MLRPIDTQIIYQQSQEVANQQQTAKTGEEMQQTQFAQMLHKETVIKQEAVSEVREDEKIRNDLKHKKGEQGSSGKKYKSMTKNAKKEEKKISEEEETCHIDIRI